MLCKKKKKKKEKTRVTCPVVLSREILNVWGIEHTHAVRELSYFLHIVSQLVEGNQKPTG